MALDERLERELHRAARPADPSGVYESLIRRRERRRIRHIAASAVVVVAVVAGSLGAYIALTSTIGSDAPTPGTVFDPGAFPPNGSIVFDRTTDGHGQHLWISDPDGSARRQLTSGEVIDMWPAWSADGSTIAFVREALTPGDIRLAFVDISDGTVTLSEGLDNGLARPDWSPDGSKLTVAGIRPPGIYVMDRDGSVLARITDDRFLAPDNPEWSPDGSTIAFSANLDADPSSWDVYVVAPDGTGLRDLTNTPDEEESESVIAWLPNGNLLIARSPGSISTGPGLPLQPEVWLEIRCQPNVDAISGASRAFVSVTSYPKAGSGDNLEVKETTFFLDGRYLSVENVSTFSWPTSDRTRPFLDSGGCGTSLPFR
jgi:hypothetical protein